jgi:hypothetical protein
MVSLDDIDAGRRALLRTGATGLALLGGVPGIALRAQEVAASQVDSSVAQAPAFQTTVRYVVEFYPLWFTYYQSFVARQNTLAGPVRVTPLYQIVVAINVDTIYASSFLFLEEQPVVLTIPPTAATYSVLNLNPYGEIFETGIRDAGIYCLTAPDYHGPMPAGATQIEMPFDVSILIFRADRYSATNLDQTAAARAFQRALKLQTLLAYQQDPAGGGTLVLPEAVFSLPFKTAADELATTTPIAFLNQLQRAVNSANTPPLSPEAQALVAEFDALFAEKDSSGDEPAFRAGVRTAHRQIIDNYLSQRGATNWITFTNIGDWGDHVLDRAFITEFIQYANGRSTAAYYHAFHDGAGDPLDGRNNGGYVLNFPKDQLPEAERFWSLTAYTPDSIELIRNPARKYAVARYTPGLEYNEDGSLSVYITTLLPRGVPEANWLPVVRQPFNIMLRVYGPEGAVADNTYVPPPIVRRF